MERLDETAQDELQSGVDTFLVGTMSQQYMKIFDQDDQPLTLSGGEIAVPRKEATRAGLSIGEPITIRFGEVDRTFTIAAFTKDVVFGSRSVSVTAYYISKEEYDEIATLPNVASIALVMAETVSGDSFGNNVENDLRDASKSEITELLLSDLRKAGLLSGATFPKALLRYAYMVDVLIASILTVVSICLILIAFLVLRFTIVLTIRENYKEIGIMKAIGMNEASIGRIYLVKYLGMSVGGGLLGLLFSFPVGDTMQNMTMNNVILASSHSMIQFWLHLLCACIVVALVLFFCWRNLRKLSKISTMQAIRNGSNAERYRAKTILPLQKRKKMGTIWYMACNDILCHFKRYVALILVYTIAILMTQLCLSALHTLNSEDIVVHFSMRNVTCYMDKGAQYIADFDPKNMVDEMQAIQENLAQNGIECRVYSEAQYGVTCYSADPEEIFGAYAWQAINYNAQDYRQTEGRFPKYDNEVTMTKLLAKKMNVEIGDEITLIFPWGEKKFLITGSYESMDNLGEGMRFNTDVQLDANALLALMPYHVEVLSNIPQNEAMERIAELYPEFTIKTTKEYLARFLGSYLQQLQVLVTIVTILSFGIASLVTVLMCKGFLSQERGEVAILKSIGYTDRILKCWQSLRILISVSAAVLLGSLLSIALMPVTISPLFGMLGSAIDLVIKPLEFFVLYPVSLIVVGGSCAYLAVAELSKIQCREVNSIE
jgi:putative ABC transport system permease protein